MAKQSKELREALAIAAAVRSAYEPNADSAFAHLRGVTLDYDNPKYKALVDWANTLAKAEQIVRAKERDDKTVATAAAILRAGKIARGEVVELPTDATARATFAAGRKRRAESGEQDA